MSVHCVYTHSANGKVFYVGQGSESRPYDRRVRTPRWREHVKSAGGFEISICHRTNNRAEAIHVECELIATHRPACNVHKDDRRPYLPYRLPLPLFCTKVNIDVKRAIEAAADDDSRSVSSLVLKILVEWLKARKYLK